MLKIGEFSKLSRISVRMLRHYDALTILVDMDDTIEQLLPVWVQGLNEKFDRHVACEDVLSWDVDDAYPGLTHEQILSVPNDIKGIEQRDTYIEGLIQQMPQPELVVLPELSRCSYMASQGMWKYADDCGRNTAD